MAPETVRRAAGTTRWPNAADYHPTFNAAPGAALPVVRLAPEGGGSAEIFTMRCGQWSAWDCYIEGNSAMGSHSHQLQPTACAATLRPSHSAANQACRWGLVPSYTKKDDRPDFFRMVGAAAGAGCEQGAAQAWCCARLHAAVTARLLGRIRTSLPPPLRTLPMHPPTPPTHPRGSSTPAVRQLLRRRPSAVWSPPVAAWCWLTDFMSGQRWAFVGFSD